MAYSTGPVTVGTTVTPIATVPQMAATVPVTNTGAVTVYLGGPSVAASGASQGFPLAPSTTVNVPAALSEDNTLYGITASSTSTVSFLLPGSVE
jgi:hypothetical protein